MIERIEVLNGGQALFYGTQAVAGAINIVTKGFSDHADGAVSVGYDTNQAQQYNGFYRDTVGNNHFVVYATHDQAPGIQPFPDADFQPSGTDRRRFYKVTSLGGKYAYDFTDDLTISAGYEHTNANLDFAQPMLTAIAYNQRNEDLVSAKLDYMPSDEFKLYIKHYYHWWYSHYTEFDNVVGNPGSRVTIDDHDFWGFKDYGTRGVELTLDGSITPSLAANFSTTYNKTRRSGSDVQFKQVPITQMKIGLDYHPQGAAFGASVNIVHLGDVDDEPLGTDGGRFGYGNYTVVDLGARYFLDSYHHQRIDLHLNNAFDRAYSSSLGHGVDDVSGDAYVVHKLALPRTFGANYTYSF
jgi:outer membrane cobalamin receptor